MCAPYEGDGLMSEAMRCALRARIARRCSGVSVRAVAALGAAAHQGEVGNVASVAMWRAGRRAMRHGPCTVRRLRALTGHYRRGPWRQQGRESRAGAAEQGHQAKVMRKKVSVESTAAPAPASRRKQPPARAQRHQHAARVSGTRPSLASWLQQEVGSSARYILVGSTRPPYGTQNAMLLLLKLSSRLQNAVPKQLLAAVAESSTEREATARAARRHPILQATAGTKMLQSAACAAPSSTCLGSKSHAATA